jgi:thiol-disulfide isomerase/thioredoxin
MRLGLTPTARSGKLPHGRCELVSEASVEKVEIAVRKLLLIAVLISAVPFVVCAEDTGLPEGWSSRTTVLPKTDNSRGSQVLVWVEKGWLLARRWTGDDDLEWQVVLARASDPAVPQIKLDEESKLLEVRYREYFIREGKSFGHLRIYRERKTDESPEWPALSLKGERQDILGLTDDVFSLDQWCWVACGRSSKYPDLSVRLQPTINMHRRGKASRGRLSAGQRWTTGGPTEMFYGDSQIQDEGDLFIATRMTLYQAERGLIGFELDDALEAERAPELAAREWLNGAAPVSLDKLEDQVVLLYFWADWCQASVDKLMQVEQLHTKFGDRGLVVIGIHSSERIARASQTVRNSKVSFPVMIDSGKTAERYRVGALPNCFVINKAGKVVWGYGMVAPYDGYIEKLLK